MKVNREHWIWQPHAGHFCLGDRCCFTLNTYVNGYIVSTIGELRRQSSSIKELNDLFGDIDFEVRDVPEKYKEHLRKFQTVSAYAFYETAIFKSLQLKEDDGEEFLCCKYRIDVKEELHMTGYNDPVSAYNGHIELCHECDKEYPSFIERCI